MWSALTCTRARATGLQYGCGFHVTFYIDGSPARYNPLTRVTRSQHTLCCSALGNSTRATNKKRCTASMHAQCVRACVPCVRAWLSCDCGRVCGCSGEVSECATDALSKCARPGTGETCISASFANVVDRAGVKVGVGTCGEGGAVRARLYVCGNKLNLGRAPTDACCCRTKPCPCAALCALLSEMDGWRSCQNAGQPDKTVEARTKRPFG